VGKIIDALVGIFLAVSVAAVIFIGLAMYDFITAYELRTSSHSQQAQTACPS
jgi:presenilin-like A22 family membrane protease